MCEELDGQLTWSDLDISFGKMSLEHSQAESQKEQTSKPSLKRSQKSSAKKPPLFLFLKRDGLKPDASAEWVTAAAPFPSLGDYMMGNTGEQPSMLMEECGCEELPSGVSVSRLSQILEDSAPPKYYLSAKACAGILNRANRRGKALPPELKTALENQCGNTPVTDGDEECDPQD